ncbi:MAG: multifunctional CCA tRNA nucleotidyl transferase/2'3'-cyclic phosphodiesterase/2'nucleotidase/phosphatase [Betaproteobacteria bacterium]|nr:multifunctional CCA tRNA nucleotidyl transferase/2'3'-cyclic phosphodiesterase/2'nucleotidase/phosphatase [Betaproteobacteria bacterium]
MKVYTVGGAVRDELLGLPVKDRDYVVTGATPEEMVSLGYRPVGRDFPVFLHPQTHQEYALARTERKVARGYRGFQVYSTPEVTLEEDLARRDLTINAMARDEAGRLVDPFGGADDLREGVLRHVSRAFVEDPVRILRVARFASRYGFAIAETTRALMREMVADGEADALVAERVWQEFSKGLMETAPARMFVVLEETGLLQRLLPEFALRFSGEQAADEATRAVMAALAHAAQEALPLEVRFALLVRQLRGSANGESALRDVCERLRVPAGCRDAALLTLRHADQVRRMPDQDQDADRIAQALLAVLEGSDAFRRPGRLKGVAAVCQCEEFGERGWVRTPYPPVLALQRALAAARAVDAAAIAAGGPKEGITARLRAARARAIYTSHASHGSNNERAPQ